MSSTQNKTKASRAFVIVQQISSYINKDHLREIADKAKGLDVEENQLVVDLLYIVGSCSSAIRAFQRAEFCRPSRKATTS
jgi:hypothetical protein